MSRHNWFWPNLAAIAVAAVLCGVSLYHRAHGNDFKQFAQFRDQMQAIGSGTLSSGVTPPGGVASRALKGSEVLELLAEIPDDAPMRPDRNQRMSILVGGHLGQVWGSGSSRSSYYNITFSERGATIYLDGAAYFTSYDAATADRIKAQIARLMRPLDQPK